MHQVTAMLHAHELLQRCAALQRRGNCRGSASSNVVFPDAVHTTATQQRNDEAAMQVRRSELAQHEQPRQGPQQQRRETV